MKQEMHDRERIKSRAQIIHDNAGAFGEPLQPADWKRLQNIEDTKEYKAREERFPGERDSDERDQLAGDLVDDDELRIFGAVSAGDAGCGGDADEGDEGGCDDSCPSASVRRNARKDQRPGEDSEDRSPSTGAGLEAAGAEKSRDESCPKRTAGMRRRRGAGAMVRGYGFALALFQDQLSVSSGSWGRISSSASVSVEVTGITYAPLAHLPRSIERQRSLQKGKSGPADFTGFLQIGQRSLREDLRGIGDFRGQRSDYRDEILNRAKC